MSSYQTISSPYSNQYNQPQPFSTTNQQQQQQQHVSPMENNHLSPVITNNNHLSPMNTNNHHMSPMNSNNNVSPMNNNNNLSPMHNNNNLSPVNINNNLSPVNINNNLSPINNNNQQHNYDEYQYNNENNVYYTDQQELRHRGNNHNNNNNPRDINMPQSSPRQSFPEPVRDSPSCWKSFKYMLCFVCKRRQETYTARYDPNAADENINMRYNEDPYIYQLYRYYLRNKYRNNCILFFICLLLIGAYYYGIYYGYSPQRADEEASIKYKKETRAGYSEVIKSTNKQVFKTYSSFEYRERMQYKNAYLLEEWLRKNPNAACVSTLEIPEITNYPYHIVLKNYHTTKDNIQSEFLHLIYPIYNVSEVIPSAYIQYKEEFGAHCARLNMLTDIKVNKGRKSHIIVHYRGLDEAIYHMPMYKDAAACVQHYYEIYNGSWPCVADSIKK
jgi:hypothetical protein